MQPTLSAYEKTATLNRCRNLFLSSATAGLSVCSSPRVLALGWWLLLMAVHTTNDSFGASEPTPYRHKTAGHVWMPAPGTSWQWQLTGPVDISFDVDMYNIDLFDAPVPIINTLKHRGVTVICYFSAGSSEDWRTDAAMIPRHLQGSSNGWEGERWLDIRQIDQLAPAMTARLDLAVSKGCDGVEPDNVDAYSNTSGFSITAQHQLSYNIWLAAEAHARGLSVGLKNNLALVEQLQPYFDWALNEQCFEYNECEALLPFIESGKAVFGVEYRQKPQDFCSYMNALDFDWLKKTIDLDAQRISCR